MRSAGWEPARGTLTEADSMMRQLTREVEFYASILHENWARFIFFNPEARSFYADWHRAARESVAILRSEAGRSPHMTQTSPTSSVNSPRKARSSAGSGPRAT